MRRAWLSRIEGDSGIGIGIGMVLYGCSVSVMVLWLFLQGFWVSNKFGMILIMCAFLPSAYITKSVRKSTSRCSSNLLKWPSRLLLRLQSVNAVNELGTFSRNHKNKDI